MRFLHPSFLPLLWLALVPLALYLFRRKSRSVRVSTLIFFKSLAREHQESAWLRWLKRILSLVLTLCILLAPIFALARLVIAPGGGHVRSVVILLDRSASMAARDARGKSRLDDAKAQLRARLDALPESVPVALMAYDARPEIAQPKSTNRRALLRSIDEIVIRPMEDDAAAALVAGARLAALETPAEIWQTTDIPGPVMAGDAAGSPQESAPMLPSGVSLKPLAVGLSAPLNAGLTAFEIKKVPLLHSRYQAYVQVALSAGAPGRTTVVLEPQVGGLPLARREIDLAPGQMQGLTLDVDAAQDQIFEVVVQVPGDCLDLDNRAAVRLPAPRPLLVEWFTAKADPFTDLALNSIANDGEIVILTGGPAAWPPAQKPDVAIFDGWLPPQWPADIPVIVINPPGSRGPVRAVPLAQPVPRDSVRVADDQHPVLFRVSSSRIALTQTAVLDTSGSCQPLWLAGDQPLLTASEAAGQRLVVMGFVPSLSEQLPLTASYPLLLGNAIYWCAEKGGRAHAPQLLKTGTLVEAPGGALEWREQRGTKLSDPARVPAGATGLSELDRLGLWKSADGSQEGSALLLSRHETDLPAAGESTTTGSGVGQPSTPHAWLIGDITWLFLWTALAVLVLESWLFHRHSVH